MRMTTKSLAVFGLALAASSALTPVTAQELKMGMAAEPSAMDPHFHNLTPNHAMREHIFDTLVRFDENYKVEPALAESWTKPDETTWVFKLRPGVKFTDGAPFEANDVIYSFCRIPTVENSPSSLIVNTKGVAAMQAPDANTLIIKTEGPYPLLAADVANIGILSAKANGAGAMTFDRKGCQGASSYPKTDEFNSGKAAVGTGPYKLVSYTKGDRAVLQRNENYWGKKPAWEKVTIRFITSDAPRVAALLAGDVDFIERPPIQDLDRIKQAGFDTVQGLSSRLMYLHFNYLDEPGPDVQGTNGKNPFRDKRVREAISKAIDRKAIVERIMRGVAMPAGEMLPPNFAGANADAKPDNFDAEGAKKLLAEAGYPNGFSIVLGASNDRYINDGQIAQAIAQMLTRIGIKTQVNAMTASQFFAQRNKRAFSVWQSGWSADTGEMSSPLKALIGTPSKEKGMGTTNPGAYSNAAVDELTEKALRTVDDAERNKLLAQATKMSMADYGLIPLHFEITPWAFKKGLSYTARADQYTVANGIGKK